ncbi:MAG: hypothetical protein ACQERZ_05130 [Fusobacteriota bacterium]
MGAIHNKIKKVKPNTITIIDLILVGVLFLVMKTYFTQEKPIKKKIKSDKIEYIINLNKYEYTRDEFLIININLRNKTKEKVEIPIEKQVLFNYEIIKDNELIYKRDYIEKNRNQIKKIVLPARTTTTLSSQWFWEDIESGIYDILVYSHDFNFKTKLKFKVLGDEKNE